jgi:hypothetical protein
MAEATEQTHARQRKTLAAILVIALTVSAAYAVRWIWRDITYWSRSVTFTHGSESLEICLPRALPALPGVSIQSIGDEVHLDVPGLEGALVKPTPEPRVARIVAFGHSASVSTLGPPAEEPVTAALQSLKSAFSASCGSP